MRYVARVGEREFRVEVTPRGGGRFRVSLDDRALEVERRGEGPLFVLAVDGVPKEAAVVAETDGPGGRGRGGSAGESAWSVHIGGRPYDVTLYEPLWRRTAAAGPARDGPVEVSAIMPGKIVALLAGEGDRVKAGQGVVVVEAMKMENELQAPKDGRVTRVRVRPGETVEAGAPLLTIE